MPDRIVTPANEVPALRKPSKQPKHVYVSGINIPVGTTHVMVFDTQLLELERRVKNKMPLGLHDRMLLIASVQFLRDNGERIQNEWARRAVEMIGTEGHGIPNWKKTGKNIPGVRNDGEGVG